MLDEANAYERGMDDDLTFQTVRELAGTAYMAGRSAPPTDAEVEAVAKNGSAGTAANGMASKATMWRRTKTMHGITPVKSADIRKTTSRGRKKCSKWHVRR